MSSQLLWYSARAAGFVAWTLAAAAVIWGLVVSTRAVTPRPKPAWWFDLHRFLGGAAVVFTGIHVVSILLDSYVHFGLVNVLVPLTGSWHPVAIAWGIVAMYLLLAVEISSLLRSRIPKRAWRAVHFATFGLYVIATVHAFTAGTDAWSLAFVGAATASLIAVGGLTLLRVWQASGRRAARPATRQSAGRPARAAIALRATTYPTRPAAHTPAPATKATTSPRRTSVP